MGDLHIGLANLTATDSTLQVLLGACAFIILVLVVWNVILSRKLYNFKLSWAAMTEGVDGENLERLLKENMRQNVQIETNIEEILERLSKVEDRLRASKRYVGVVRYNAFNDVGGDQSFALAMYDDDGNGAVLTSQVGRHDCRVYGKPLFNGKSDLNLTVEEQRAIDQAASPSSRPRISP